MVSRIRISVFGGMRVLALDGENGVGGTGAQDLPMANRLPLRHQAFHQTAWWLERRIEFIRQGFRRT